MPNVQALASAVAAACPGATVYIGDPADRTTWGAVFPSGATSAQQQAVAQVIAGWTDPIPPRFATVSALLDVLSTSERAMITVDHMGRLVARAALGPVLIADPKIVRAAADMSLTTDTWFKMAGS